MASNVDIIESFSEFKEIKNIDRVTMMKVLEEVFRTMIKKKYGTDENFDIIVNAERGDLEIYHNRTIVEDGMMEDDVLQIEHSDVQEFEPDLEIGEEYSVSVTIPSFGRRAILTARQILQTKISELEKEEVLQRYKDREGEVVNAEVHSIWKKEILVMDDQGNELVLPKSEQIPMDHYKKGDTLKAVITKVEYKNNAPSIQISRTSPMFLERLFENEVPEIMDGLISIKNIVREPGERAKVAVESYDDRIDPVGACVGMKGSRIHGIVRELRNENIDVINYTTNKELYITRALSPAKITKVEIKEDIKKAQVFLKPDQVSLAIGKGGMNIKSAARLTGYEIDVFRETDEDEFDIDLEEFADEIDSWIIDSFKAIGCDTGRSVLSLSAEEIERRTDLEKETIAEVIAILKAEFDEN